MSWSEVEDFALASVEAAAASEDFASLEPADEDQLVGGGDVEELAVHFCVFDLEVVVDTLSNRVPRRHNP